MLFFFFYHLTCLLGENCRAHRRKCVIVEGNQCDRCIKTKTFCVFKFNVKPTILRKPVPTSKKNRLIQQVKKLEQQLADLEDQLKNLHIEMKLEPSVCSDLDDESVGTDESLVTTDTQHDWQLTVTYGPEGTSLQTSIKNLTDIHSFMAETYRYFHTSSTPFRTPNYHADRSSQTLAITNPMLQIEYVLHGFIQNKKKSATLAVPPACDDFTRIQIKRQVIQSYFDCLGVLSPVFPRPYYLPYFENNLDAMLTNAMASFTAYTQCRHVLPISYPMTREAIAESFRNEAKEQLEDVLFEQEPSIFTAATLLFLSQSALIVLDNTEARLYMNLAWRMVVGLKSKYEDKLIGNTGQFQTAENIEAESWRRLFYSIRYLELSLYAIYDGLDDFTSILFDTGIGYPVVLQIEQEDKLRHAVEAFREIVRMHDCQLSQKDDQIKYKLFTGRLEELTLHDLQRLEIQLCDFWKGLPQSFRLSDSPFDYLQIERIHQCSNPYAIYLNQMYYVQWLSLETRLMQSPSFTDLDGASMDRYDGERALLLVSICTDAISKIFHVLYCKLPCNVELHWMLVAADAMGMLKRSANPQIRARATASLKATLGVIKHRTQKHSPEGHDNYRLLKSMLPSIAPGEGSSTSSGSLTGSEPESYPDMSYQMDDNEKPTDYFDVVDKVIDTYLTKDEIVLI